MHHWIDSHNHLQDPHLGDSVSVMTTMKAVGITRAIINATCESDWAKVEQLVEHHPDFLVPAFGVHPWQSHTTRIGWQDRLRAMLESHPEASVGECGLDSWVSKPPLEIQREVFRDQLRIANDLARPITIHCLKAWQLLFEVFDEVPPRQSFLMHSFGSSIEIARRLIPLGAYFSFSGHFLQPHKSTVLEMFKALPRDRILIETDAPSMLPPREIIGFPLPAPHHHPANLPAIGEGLALSLDLSIEKLSAITRKNTARCFGW